jgi:hypothetical protein
VHYNVGVASVRLGRYDRAERAFIEVARTPAMAPLAWYNLGLVALARGEEPAARRWFERTRNSGGDAALIALANERLATLAPPAAVDEPSPWSVFASLGAGHDDNVALRAEGVAPLPTGEADEFIEVQAAVSRAVGSRWRAELGAYHVDYLELDGFDQSAFALAARGTWAPGDWITHVTMQGSYLTLDDDGLERSATLGLSGETAIGEHGTLRAGYRGARVVGLDDFEGLTGVRQEAVVAIERALRHWRLGVEYRVEDSDADEPRFASTWHQLALFARRTWAGGRWAARFDVRQRRTRYDERGSGDPDERLEDRTLVAASLSRALGASLRATARAEFETNRASGALFDYDRTRVTLGLEYAR